MFAAPPLVACLLAAALGSSPVSGQTITPPAAANAPDSGDYAIVQRGPNSRLWQRTLLDTNIDGTVTTNTQSYTELATGLCYISNAANGSNSQWLDAVEEIDPVPGGAQAIQGSFQVRFANNANTPGATVVTTLDSKTLSSTLFGLAYFDVATGSNAAIAWLKDCDGAITSINQVTYADAFSNIAADLCYTYTKAGLSQDVVLLQALPPPDGYGLSDASSVFQIYTEFFSTAPPGMTLVTNGSVVDSPVLDFGDMKMGAGEALFLNGQAAPVTAGTAAKQWVTINNRIFLVESIPYAAICNVLQQLPHVSNLKPGRGSVGRLALLESPPSRPGGSAKAAQPMKLAKAETARPRLAADYVLLSSTNTLTLQADQTYLVTGLVNVTGTVTIEGGTVVKYTTNAGAEIEAPNFLCQTGPYSPAVFTATNDNSVGTVISGSTGSPSRGPTTYLNVSVSTTNSSLFNYLRFSYASNAVWEGAFGGVRDFWNCQFFNCGTVIFEAGGTADTQNFHNVLISRCLNVANCYTAEPPALSLHCDQATVDQVQALAANFTSPTLYATNSIFTAVTNWPATIYSNSCSIYGASNSLFQSVGAANYYLASGSTNLGHGTASVDSNLLADLQTLTTWPPVVLPSGLFTGNTNLSPQAQRNTGTPDLGYHYPPLDFALNIEVSNATITVMPGTVLAACGSNFGIWLSNKAVFNCEGTATSPNYIVRYNTVQEQSNPSWESTNWVASLLTPIQLDTSSANFAFTDWSVLEAGGQIYSEGAACPIALQNCQFYGGAVTANGLVLSATNSLFHRVNTTVTEGSAGGVSETFYNNLFLAGELSVRHYYGGIYTFRDNLFDQAAVALKLNQGYKQIDYCSNNAYVTTTNGFLSPTNGDIFLTNSPAYQVGALGQYYYPTSLTNLIHTGSQSAPAAGLYYYTVTTNNVIEGTNTVSIGFHNVATDSNGVPLGAAGGGVADYLEDPSGNGIINPFLIFDQAQYPNEPQVRLGYWRFNNPTSWPNEAGLCATTDTGLWPSNSFSGSAVSLTGTGSGSQLVYPVSANGVNYFNPANGTIRFWYQPNWSTTNYYTPTNGVVFFEAPGSSQNTWQLTAVNLTNTNGIYIQSIIQFGTRSNQYTQPWSFNTEGINGAFVNFQSNFWSQIVLTYSPTNVALYTNGILLATATFPQWLLTNFDGGTYVPLYEKGNGNIYSPPASDLTSGFSFGNVLGGTMPVMGQLDELETFNYPLTAQKVAAGYPYFGGNPSNMVDTCYIGVSDMLQTNVYGFPQAASTNSIPVRLGYWRFDSSLLYAEQGQMPLSFYNVGLTNSWSGTALVVNTNGGQITYPDVGSNGWANINCRQGSLRFWFKLNGSAPTYAAPFVYLGSPDGHEKWTLQLNTGGNTISFVTATNGITASTNLTANCNLSTTNWTQIVLTYGPSGSSLYTNGSPANTAGAAVTHWPSLTNRTLGMVLGNTTAHDAAINGQFEEMETFNYQLAPADISNNFQIVASVDSDLNGIPDLLEDIHLTTARPFLGAPVVITGTVEAEQFDMGSNNVGYHNVSVHPTNSYRPTGMYISTCDDLGGGYCLDQTQAGDWSQYTINVLVPQTYTIETRVAGLGTNGAFKLTFATNGTNYTNTGPLIITSTNWTNLSAVVSLNAGTNVMTLMLSTNANTNGTSGPNVGRFNYISIYPYWTPPTNGPQTNYVSATTLSNGSDYFSASNNAYIIQSNVNNLTNGGLVQIPAGTWYLSQAHPNDVNDAYTNAAVSIVGNNIELAGAGETNTVLIANNRATTIFCLGRDPYYHRYQCTNFSLHDLTLEGQPHQVAFTNQSLGYTNLYELGQLNPTPSWNQAQGSLAAFYGLSNQYSYNICISNCLFRHGVNSLVPYLYISNFMVRACTFIPWDTNCFFTGATNTGATNTATSWTYNTTNGGFGEVGVFGAIAFNAVILENTYIGNSAMTNTNTTCGHVYTLAPAGFVWFQTSGNVFVARNTISNNALEAVQLVGGPNSVVGNQFGTLVSDGGCCALNAFNGGVLGATGTTNLINYSTCFIGNSVCGGRDGEEGTQSVLPFTLNFSGNSLNLYLPFDSTKDWLGGAVWAEACQAASVCGNTLLAGSHGFHFFGANTKALILNNAFGTAANRAMGCAFTGDTLTNVQVFGNTLGQGVSFHVQLPYPTSFGWFLDYNQYVDTNGVVVPLFLDPASSAVHLGN